ncbi:MAG: HAMP domain-containing protein [Polyangiaceae bacterium]|nr:HAMP domain-containing protein [Polyangiaceae bacterium]
MTLAQRLLLAIGVLTIATTVSLALGLREAWRSTEEAAFQAAFQVTAGRLRGELGRQAATLPALVEPLCRHDPTIDGALVDLRAGALDPGRRLALSLRVPELMRAFSFDELWLVTGRGEVLGAGHDEALTGKRDPELGRRIATSAPTRAHLRRDGNAPALETHCRTERGTEAVGLIAARRLDSLLADLQPAGVTLSLGQPRPNQNELVESLAVPELGGLIVYATQSRVPLHRALQRLDATILAMGSVTFGAALMLAFLLARGLARPIVKLSEQAREVVHGEPRPVQGRGGRELRELASSFNQAIADLVALRKRLAATERIAARREIARRVAHEIKNPLAPIRTAVETLRRLRARDDPAFDEYFDEATRTVLDEVTRISNIVSEFTRFARLPPPNPAPIDLAATVRQVVGLHTTEGVPITLTTETVPVVTADRDQVVQVTTNLVQNALEACRSQPNARVEVELRPFDAERVALRVRDNGPGVAPEMLDRLFEPYATTKTTGTGLGLAIVQRIVVEHGGEISYRGRPAGGAEFEVMLPIAGPTLLPEAPNPSSAEPRG